MRETRDRMGFRREFARYSRIAAAAGEALPLWEERHPCFGERTESTPFDRHYVYHTAWAARILARTLPARHVDISSSLYFVAILSAFLPLEHYERLIPLGPGLQNVVVGGVGL